MIQYLIQVIAYTGAMLLLYHLLLRDKPLHRFNRMYLLSVALLPAILPLLKLPESLRPKQETTPLLVMLQEVKVGGAEEQQAVPLWLWLIPATYIVIMLVVLVTKLAAYIKMRRVIGRSVREQYDGYTVLKNSGYGPGSWGRYIFLPEGDVDATIIQHELSHVRLHHSRDIIFINLVQAIFWPNIFIHLLKKELVQVHEFQADAAVGITGEAYTKLLLASVFGTCALPFTHSFIIHPIKRRIMMLHNNRKNGKLRGVVASLSAVVLLAGIVTMQSCEQKKEAESLLTEAKVEKANDSVFSFVHKMPEPDYNLGEYLGKLIIYPEEAKLKQIEGRVAVKFVVGKDGKVSGMEVKDKNIDPLLRDAAIKAVAQLPDWIPGEDEHGNKVPVYFTLPINFKLDDEDKITSARGLSDKEVEEFKRKMEREVEAMRAQGHDVMLVDTDDPVANRALGEVYSLLSDASNPVVVNPKKDMYRVKDKSLTLTQIVTKLTNDEGVEMEVIPVEVSGVQH
jgi:TonB family protein